MSIAFDTQCLLCHLRRNLEVVKPLGTEQQAMEFAKDMMRMYLDAPQDVGSPWFNPQTADLMRKHYGLPLDRIVLGHLDLSGDLDYIRRVLDTGISIGFDTVGKNNYFPDAKRVEFLLALEAEGRLDQIVLSEDLTRKSHLKHKGGIGYCYLFETFLPMLKEAGFKQESLDKMLIHNPARILGA